MQNIHQAKFSLVSSSVLPTPSDADSGSTFQSVTHGLSPFLELLIGLERLNIPRQCGIISIYNSRMEDLPLLFDPRPT
jgi:hypothetical protein